MTALGLYSALPARTRWDDDCAGWLAPSLPVVGLVLGALWVGVAALAGRFLPPMLAAAVLSLALPAMTGFLHLDGFMDTADALLSFRPLAEKQRILRDPHAGSFAVISLFCLMILQTACCYGIAGDGPIWPLLPLPIVSRALAALSVMRLRPMQGSQYSRMNYDLSTPGRRAFVAVLLALTLVAVTWLDLRAGAACALAAAAFIAACAMGVRQLDGMNGDIAGFSICCAEMAGLLVLAIW